MKVAMLLEALGGGGVERTTLKLADGLIAQGFQVDLLLIRPAGRLVSEVPTDTVTRQLAASGGLSRRYSEPIPPDSPSSLDRCCSPGERTG
jgi:hypothetical protein